MVWRRSHPPRCSTARRWTLSRLSQSAPALGHRPRRCATSLPRSGHRSLESSNRAVLGHRDWSAPCKVRLPRRAQYPPHIRRSHAGCEQYFPLAAVHLPQSEPACSYLTGDALKPSVKRILTTTSKLSQLKTTLIQTKSVALTPRRGLLPGILQFSIVGRAAASRI